MNIGWGVAGVLAGGLLNGSFVAPMKWMSKWRWENSWLVYSVAGLLVIPWLTASRCCSSGWGGVLVPSFLAWE